MKSIQLYHLSLKLRREYWVFFKNTLNSMETGSQLRFWVGYHNLKNNQLLMFSFSFHFACKDSGVDPNASGLEKLPNGKRKVIERVRFISDSKKIQYNVYIFIVWLFWLRWRSNVFSFNCIWGGYDCWTIRKNLENFHLHEEQQFNEWIQVLETYKKCHLSTHTRE